MVSSNATCEICNYQLQGGDLVTRDVAWSPKFITFDLFPMHPRIWDLRELAQQIHFFCLGIMAFELPFIVRSNYGSLLQKRIQN